MSVLAHKWVASGALNGKAAFAKARVAVVLHGIMGSGRNWMTAARAIVKNRPDYKVLLVDHRGHGANGSAIPGPHDVLSCGRDVEATIAAATGGDAPTPSEPEALSPCGTAPMVLGHSFGGKVALAYARQRMDRGAAAPTRTWLLDSNPQRARSDEPTSTSRVLAALESRAALSYPDKKAAVAALRAEGLDAMTAQWLAMTTGVDDAGSVRFTYDVAAVRRLFESYVLSDCTEVARELADQDRFGLVVAGRGQFSHYKGRRFGAEDRTYALPDAGHNVHVDDLPGLLDILLVRNAPDWGP